MQKNFNELKSKYQAKSTEADQLKRDLKKA